MNGRLTCHRKDLAEEQDLPRLLRERAQNL